MQLSFSLLGVESTFWKDYGIRYWRTTLVTSRSRWRISRNWKRFQQVSSVSSLTANISVTISLNQFFFIIFWSVLFSIFDLIFFWFLYFQWINRKQKSDIVWRVLKNIGFFDKIRSDPTINRFFLFITFFRYGRVNFVLARRMHLLEEVQRLQVRRKELTSHLFPSITTKCILKRRILLLYITLYCSVASQSKIVTIYL